MKIRCLLFLLLFAIACGEKKSPERYSSISISEQKFENQRASELNSLGIKKAEDGKHESAKELFFQALNLEPDNPTILSNIGLYYQGQEMNQKAIEYHQKSFVASDSAYLISGANLGHVYYQIGDYSSGIKILDFVIENGMENRLLTVAHINRGFNHLEKGDCKKAKSDLNFAKSNASKDGELNFQIERLEKKIKNCVQQNL